MPKDDSSMPQVTRCPHCGKAIQVPEAAAGRQVRCPHCKRPFAVPAARARELAAAGAPARPAAPAAPASEPEVHVSSGETVLGAGTTAECPACKAALLPG